MIWDDIGFLLSKNRYNENSLIVEIFTQNHGKISGIIFGGTSKKIKNYLQIGNLLYVNYNSKSENKIGYFKIEIQKAFSPLFFNDPQKLSCITSSMHLLKLLTAEFQANKKIFDLIHEFFLIISNEIWLKEYIFWELKLFRTLGYDLEIEKLVSKKIINNKIIYVVTSLKEDKIVPNFLINKKNTADDIKTLLNGLSLVSDYLDKTVLKPNNLNYPITRINFFNSLK